MNTTIYTLSNQSINLLNAVEAIADNGNRKAEKMLQRLFKRVQRRNRQAEQQGLLPASFVLADLFDVEAMSNDVPEHVHESDPSLEWVTCSCCDGQRFVETNGNGWTKSLFADPRMVYVHHNLSSSYKVCGRCSGVGEVLDFTTPTAKPESLLAIPESIYYPVQLAA
jgi:hypothetical protein